MSLECLLKMPTNPLCPFKMTNVRVSGVAESSGTSFWTTLLVKGSVIRFINIPFYISGSDPDKFKFSILITAFMILTGTSFIFYWFNYF